MQSVRQAYIIPVCGSGYLHTTTVMSSDAVIEDAGPCVHFMSPELLHNSLFCGIWWTDS